MLRGKIESGAPAIPTRIPASRLPFVTMRSVSGPPDLEGETFVFMTDTREWIVDDEADAACIRASDPTARIIVRE